MHGDEKGVFWGAAHRFAGHIRTPAALQALTCSMKLASTIIVTNGRHELGARPICRSDWAEMTEFGGIFDSGTVWNRRHDAYHCIR